MRKSSIIIYNVQHFCKTNLTRVVMFFYYLCTLNIIMRKIKNLLSLFCVVLFVSYYANTVFFFHTHTDEWGRKFTHSHSHSSSNHSHSENDIQLINSLTHIVFVAGVVAVFLALSPISETLLYSFYKQCIPNSQINYKLLRAPPAQA